MSPEAAVTTIKLRHINRFRDRHGHLRHYLRLPGRSAVALPGAPGSPEFMAAYHAEIAKAAPAPREARAAVHPGSFDALAIAYYASDAWAELRGSTQAAYRRIVESIRAKHGANPWRLLDPEGVRLLLAEKRGHPTAANHRLRVLRALATLAMDLGWRRDDPTAGVRKHRYDPGEGFRSWPEEEVAKFRAHWPEESLPRRAFELLREGGLRRSDAVRAGRQHVQGGLLVMRQAKTGGEVTAPISPTLARVLAHTPAGQMLFIPLPDGRQRSPRGFYNSFRTWCDEAGIAPGLSPHGLRKARGNEVADAGGSEFEVMAALGQSDPKSARAYTKRANRRRLALSAAEKVAKLKG